MKKVACLLASLIWIHVPCMAERSDGWISPIPPPEEHYRLDVSVDGSLSKLKGTGVVRVENTSNVVLRKLGLVWGQKHAVSCEITTSGYFFKIDGTSPEPEVIALDKPLRPGDEIEIGLRFELSLSEIRQGREVRLADWHPRLWWDRPHHASYDVGIDAPDGIVVATSARKHAGDARYQATGIRSFGLFFAEGYSVHERAIGDTLVRAMFPPELDDCAETLVENAIDAIDFYREKYGMYPQPILTIIPGEPAPVSGGFPFATAMVMIHSVEDFSRLPVSHWRWIIGHEVGHQYWLEHVLSGRSPVQWSWLMIGMGVMANRDYCRSRGLLEIHPGRLSSYAETVRKGMDTTVEQSPEKIRALEYDFNSQVTHNKAYGILSSLTAILGQKTFDRIALRCLREYAGRPLGTNEFRRIAEAESLRDLGWFFFSMLRTNRYASYETIKVDKSRDNGGCLTRVVLRHAGTMRLPVPVEVRFEDGTRQRAWTERFPEVQTLEFRSQSKAVDVVIDADREFLLVMPPPSKEFQNLASKVADTPWTGAGSVAEDLYAKALQLEVTDRGIFSKICLLLYDAGDYEKALAGFSRLAQLRKDQPDQRIWEFYDETWQGILLDLLGRREEALAHYQSALNTGVDVSMQHSQYDLVLDRKFVKERLEKPFVRPSGAEQASPDNASGVRGGLRLRGRA